MLRQRFSIFGGFIAALASFALAGCSFAPDDDVTKVAFIGSENDLADRGVRLSAAGQHLRGATAEGLVALDATGAVVPALAERWIVTDDGLSYIFRLRNSDWPDGAKITGENVKASLGGLIQQLDGTSLGLDLAVIKEIRAMTGRVIEIRLNSPMPQFLQLIAQPELGLRRTGQGNGPMVRESAENGLVLSVLPPARRGMPEMENWQRQFREIQLLSLPAPEATSLFEQGEVDVVLNGRLATLPLADTGPLTRGTIRLDAVSGLLGLQVLNGRGVLADAKRREAIAMAIDRDTLLQPFNIGGWLPNTAIVPDDTLDGSANIAPGWNELTLEQRQSFARGRLLAWQSANGGQEIKLTIDLPPGPGSDILFAQLSEDLAAVSVTLERATADTRADLRLVDRLARYSDARWFLNQFNCTLNRGLCSKEADALVRSANSADDADSVAEALSEAEQLLLDDNVYIPIGAPIRWSLIRGGVEGFSENRWGLHPLFPLATRPI